jgi:hypothetical protein
MAWKREFLQRFLELAIAFAVSTQQEERSQACGDDRKTIVVLTARSGPRLGTIEVLHREKPSVAAATEIIEFDQVAVIDVGERIR